MGAFTFLLLAYCLIASVNRRAAFDATTLAFNYYPKYWAWLPHSYDWNKSLEAFWNYLALAAVFWAVCDWISGEKESWDRNHGVPRRLRRLLWVLAINGAVLAFEGLLQRADGGGKLLWLVEPRINKEAVAQFGPYAYRSNAAQYFLLLWPAMLGWFLVLERSFAGDGRKPRHRILIPLILLVVLCPIVSLSRAGALVSLLNLAIAGLVLFMAFAKRHRATAATIGLGITVIASLAMFFNGPELLKRFETSSQDFESGREAIYKISKGILHDFPVFGTGPGTFEHVFQLYRKSEADYWPAQAHNDWLETALTFGWVGFGIIMALLTLALTRCLARGPIQVPWFFIALLWLSLFGCLIYARGDFPFQVYSILFLAILLCAILFSVSRTVHRGI